MTSRAWLILANAYLTVGEYAALSSRFGPVEQIARQSGRLLRDTGLSDKKAHAIEMPDQEALDDALEWLNDDAHSIIVAGSDEYPELLAQIPGAPLLLYVNGKVDALHMPALAVVGSRNPTRAGVRNAFEFSRHLASNGFSVVSGLAQGIDAAAHRGAIDGRGMTIAFLGHGIDRVYPACNHELSNEIAEFGAIVTEYPLGSPPDGRHFPERNRLISGLSLGTLVIEAARRSGSLITARLAAEQGREVFALPGSIHSPLARGCHDLIRQGAKLVETAHDIASELAPLVGHMQHEAAAANHSSTVSQFDNNGDYAALRRVLSHDPVALDELENRSGLTIGQLSSMLLILELHGEVESTSGGRYALVG